MKPLYIWQNDELQIVYPAIEEMPRLDHAYVLDSRFEEAKKRFVIITNLHARPLITPCDPEQVFPPGFKTALLLLDLKWHEEP